MATAVDLARQAVTSAVDRAIGVNTALVHAYVDRAKRSRPDANPAEIVRALDRQFMAAVTAMGGLAGASAAAPGISTGPALVVNIAEVGSFLEASAIYILALAEVHGVHVDDLERRRTLLVGVLLGNAGTSAVEKFAGRTGPYWARTLVKRTPLTTINEINRFLGPRFVTRHGTKQGVLVLGREMPFGVGGLIGGVGNAVVARGTVTAARRAFGPPPSAFPTQAEGA